MKVGVLQQFLRSLIPALEATDGRATKELGDAIAVFEPFQSLDINDFSAFLVRAKAYQIEGHIKVPSAGERQIEETAKIIERIQTASDGLPALQQEAATALQALATQVGLKGKLAIEPKWAEAKALEARLVPHRKALFELAARIASPQAYEEPVVREGMARLEQVDIAALRALALEQGIKATARAQPAKIVADVLAKLSGHQPPKTKPKSKAAAVDPAVVEEHSRRLTALIERSLNPDAVSESDVEAELALLKNLSPATLYEVVSRAGIREARPSESKPSLLKRVRNELTAARRARERAEV